MMRDHPEGIHSVILESPLPPNVPYFQSVTANFKRSLNKLFDKCAADPACKLAYPHLKDDFFVAIDSLDKKPMVISMNEKDKFPDGKFVINSQDMLLGFQQALYGKQLYPVLPLLIEQLKARNENALRGFAESMSNGIYRLSYGSYYSVICAECMPFNSVKAFEDSSAGFWKGLTFYRDEFSICNIWNPTASNSIDSAAVTSKIPVLILSGELDPIAPPSNGETAIHSLPNAYQYTFQNTGHFVSGDDKAVSLIEKFLTNPSVEPDPVHFVKTRDIAFATDVHVNGGITSLAPRLQLNKGNSFYIGWILLMVVAFLANLVFVSRAILQKKTQLTNTTRDKIYYWSALLSVVLSIYFLVRLGMVIFKTASENLFLLGFGLPQRYSFVLLVPYLIFLLVLIQIAVVPGAKNGSVKKKQMLLLLLNVPFLIFLFRFGLFY
jgi:pimeloyl-ACP methyl ester carboxylesterase